MDIGMYGRIEKLENDVKRLEERYVSITKDLSKYFKATNDRLEADDDKKQQ